MTYKERVARGLCGRAGCTASVVTGKRMCEQHLAAAAAATLKHVGKKRHAKECIHIGCHATENLSPGGRCPAHLKCSNERRKRLRLVNKLMGLCSVSSTHGPVAPGRSMCQSCLDKHMERWRKRRKEGR